MQELTITDLEAGQRLNKYMMKYLNQAPSSFIYKMLRKKNITRNGKKASGDEILEIRRFGNFRWFRTGLQTETGNHAADPLPGSRYLSGA